MIKFIFIYILIYSTITYSDDCLYDPNIIEQTKKDARSIYKHTEVMFIRLSNEEKYKVQKKIDNDKSLEIWLK